MTATTTAAREHARSQAREITDSMPVVPPSLWPHEVPGTDAASLVWAETVPGGRYTTKVLQRGTRVRLRDLDGAACAHVLLHRADAPWERLNTADTVKVPWQAYMGVGHPLLSDQGRVIATVLADSSGHHDALCGTTTLLTNTAKYGDGSAYSASPAGRELLILAALKNGLGPRDVPPTLSFFHGVTVDPDGALRSTGSAGAGREVDLILHLPVIVSIANTAHPIDPSPTFDTTSLEVLAWPSPQDLEALPNTDPEYLRAVANTEDTYAAGGSK
ncbi:urea amidolyase associated protein UAAP1 [Rhodococcus sp. NBC_00294]|uniref:urea amidolyase associated protein UAAP1 n=1 Tax=Rhodococcus sp. NBC_00294 TaxID=2976004 RepID=UPI002E2A3B3F|nr:urea amidolyase associated protein UAAP1 [Rhodococcus sp. NBC_00294]